MPGLFWSTRTRMKHTHPYTKASLYTQRMAHMHKLQAAIMTSGHQAGGKKDFPTHRWKGAVLSLWYPATQRCIRLPRSLACMVGCPCPQLQSVGVEEKKGAGRGGRSGGVTMTHKSTFKNVLCCFQNPPVTFCSPHTCTKASVVLIAGTAIRIMRPKGLSISQKAWLGKNKFHLSPWRGPGPGRVMTNLVTPCDPCTTLDKHFTLK